MKVTQHSNVLAVRREREYLRESTNANTGTKDIVTFMMHPTSSQKWFTVKSARLNLN
ncbi:hypothetical protein H4683_003330 [Filibacter limicola]|uniref:Uncharacterized protein n=1 Tax=Sporosarcina limicola TaxID=34101 RepID=A0A927MRM4_9BACL|nr:hypothetical protein [Sporosarcina limicola]MBE1556209.1 hypothetical protein [Sporosarcina limicola]